MKHLENKKNLYAWQHCFRSKRSTETQLVTLIHKLGDNLDNSKQTDIKVLDFSKAFHKVSHQLLSIKLDHYGLKGSTLRWINSFPSNRTQTDRQTDRFIFDQECTNIICIDITEKSL